MKSSITSTRPAPVRRGAIFALRLVGIVMLVLAGLITANPVFAKSLYVIANINANPTPIQTYDIQGAPNYLVFQSQVGIPGRAGGAVGLAIETDSAKLFVTYENSNIIQLVDAVSFANLGTTTAPGASNLAGIVVDQGRGKVYTVDRTTDNLFVYSFDTATNVLTLDRSGSVNLGGLSASGAFASGAHGLAIDERRDLLYVADMTRFVKVYRLEDVNDISLNPIPLADNIDINAGGQSAQGIAVDSRRNLLYAGNALTSQFGSDAIGRLVKADLNTAIVTFFDVRAATGISTETVVGLAVDEDTGNVYITTGNQASGGSDTILTFDQDLALLKDDIGRIGNPTGLAIPRIDVSFNPLNLAKIDAPDPVASGDELTYLLSFDNLANASEVTNATLVDELPAAVDFISATGGGVYDAIAHSVTWTIGTLPENGAGDSFELVVRVNALPGEDLLNRARIDSDQTGPTTRTELTEVVAGLRICDIDGDNDIDRIDLGLISRARGQPASGPTDPMDADGDGMITLSDVKACIPICSLPRCAIQ